MECSTKHIESLEGEFQSQTYLFTKIDPAKQPPKSRVWLDQPAEWKAAIGESSIKVAVIVDEHFYS